MVSNAELLDLIAKAREMGAEVNVTHDQVASLVEGRVIVDTVQILGLKGCGPYAMPALAAAEKLRELIATGALKVSVMDLFLQNVQLAMVKRGWEPYSARAEVMSDTDHLRELGNEGMTADEVAVEVIRQANARQSAIQ